MALKALSHVHEVSTSGFGGTGPVQLAGVPAAPAGRLSFATGIGNGHACEYTIEDAAGNWERVIGTLTTGAPDVLSRDIVVQNSLGTGALVNFAAGQKDIYLVGPAPLRGVLAKTANYTVTLGDHGRLIDGTGTWTLSLPAAATLGDGFEFMVRNSGAGAITIDPNGSELIDGTATLDVAPGDAFKVVCDGSALKTVGRTGIATTAVIAAAHGLVVKYVTAATVDIDADEIVLKNSAGEAFLAEAVNLTVDMAASGANGLDTGSEASATWYYIWVITDGETVAGLLSVSTTAPTMPGGYTFKALAGAVRNDGGSNFIRFWQAGGAVSMAPVAVFSGQAGVTSYASQSISGEVPAMARTVSGYAAVTTDAVMGFGLAGDANGVGEWLAGPGPAAGSPQFPSGLRNVRSFAGIPLITAQTVYWKSDNTTSNKYLAISGFTF
jgi:hypothetical protein